MKRREAFRKIKKIRESLTPRFTDRDKKTIEMLDHVTGSQPAWYDAGPKGAGEVSKLFEQVVQKQQFGKASIDEAAAEFRGEAGKIFFEKKINEAQTRKGGFHLAAKEIFHHRLPACPY